MSKSEFLINRKNDFGKYRNTYLLINITFGWQYESITNDFGFPNCTKCRFLVVYASRLSTNIFLPSKFIFAQIPTYFFAIGLLPDN